MCQEGDLCPGVPPPCGQDKDWALPHFAIIIKLLADQSLVGTAGVLEEGKRKQTPSVPMANPPGLLPVPCLSFASPVLHLPAGGDRPWSKKGQGRTPEHPLTSRVTLGNPLNLSEPQSPPWRDNMATSGLVYRIMHVAFITVLARHSPAAARGGAVAIMQVTWDPQLMPCCPQRRAPNFRCFSPCSEDRQCPGAADWISEMMCPQWTLGLPPVVRADECLDQGPNRPSSWQRPAPSPGPPQSYRGAEAPLCSHLVAGVS